MDNTTVTFEPEQNDDYKAWLAQNKQKGPKKPRNKKLWIGIGIAAAVILILIAVYGSSSSTDDDSLGFTSDYIAVIDVNGEIATGSGSGTNYNHDWTMSTLDSLIGDDHNKGLFIRVDSPGGSVYASDELYFKLKEYKEKTGRPVYAYYGSMAASGGYYVTAISDKIYANRNCWTGSIGVTLGTMFDFSGLLERYGVKVNTITSGANKAMGSNWEEMTDEQRAIFQSLVDECYEQFVGIVSEGRGLSIAEVKKLADGRIYTAKQALDLGLIDAISDEYEARTAMQSENRLESVEFEELAPEYEESVLSYFMQSEQNNSSSELSEIYELIKSGNNFTVSYRANISR